MDKKELKTKLIKRIAIFLTVMIASVAITLYLDSTIQDHSKKRDWLKNDINNLKRKLSNLNKESVQFSEVIKIWESFSDEHKKLQGLRINDAKDTLDKLKNDYNLSDVSISFSKPEEAPDENNESTTAIIISTVNIVFKALSDEHVLNFVSALLEDFPGYVQIKSFSLTRNQVATKENLRQIASGQNPAIVNGSIDFIWRDLKYKKPKNSERDS